MTSEPLDQYTEICRDAIKSSSAKLGKAISALHLSNRTLLFCHLCVQSKFYIA